MCVAIDGYQVQIIIIDKSSQFIRTCNYVVLIGFVPTEAIIMVVFHYFNNTIKILCSFLSFLYNKNYCDTFGAYTCNNNKVLIGFRSGVTVILTSDPALSTRVRAGKENAGINF